MIYGWVIYVIIFIVAVYAVQTWHTREKVPGTDEAGGYVSMYVYGAPMFALLGVAILSLFGLDCFFFLFAPTTTPRPQPGILAFSYPVLIVVAVVATLRWHYGSWRFGSQERERRRGGATTAWLVVSIVSGIAALGAAILCELGLGHVAAG